MISTTAALSLHSTATSLQAGRVRDVVAVSFARGPAQRAAEIGTSADGPAPKDAIDLSRGLLVQVQDQLQAQLQTTRDWLVTAAGGQDALTRMQDTGIMPNTLVAGLAAWQLARDSLDALGTQASPQAAPLSEEARNAFISAAIAHQVDARLAAEDTLQAAALERKLSVLSLFGEDMAAQMEDLLRLGQQAERAGRRKKMIRDMTQEVARGEISVSISMKAVWASDTTHVTPAKNSDVSVFATDRFRVAAANVTTDVTSAVDLRR